MSDVKEIEVFIANAVMAGTMTVQAAGQIGAFVQELEEKCDQLKGDWQSCDISFGTQMDINAELKAENARLRAELAHFAERSNWRTSGLTYDWLGGTLPYKTPWNIAREALEGK